MERVLLIFIISGLSSVSCTLTREYPVEYDYSYDGDFEEYKTFSFLRTNQKFDSSTDGFINKTIINYMQLLGYTYIPERKEANFLVNYFYYQDPLAYNSYDQTNISSFLKNVKKDDRKKLEYKKKKLAINNGVFVINFTDNKNYNMIWQGYTTDLYTDDILKDPNKTRIAVLSILRNYQTLIN